ncbi:hemolymph lipopolysaccharide-binding protein-like [Neocloeon triangulifer]|uniref:hemolymph lipopolysaccharide-binding protein-like n=1 Tax=Neocloeon triangulifer TaxID=2078957 RepID=UPI00286F294D|nr:hemolymph lipopolysaccharide-binding protein-like [Neocloeon triangulifer]
MFAPDSFAPQQSQQRCKVQESWRLFSPSFAPHFYSLQSKSAGLTHVFRSDNKTFEEAKASCEKLGAKLAVANSQAEAQLLLDLAKLSDPWGWYAFVGRVKEGQQWLNLDGTTVASFEWWRRGQPENKHVTLPDGTSAMENCGAIFPDGLHDVPCQWTLSYLCEFPRVPC